MVGRSDGLTSIRIYLSNDLKINAHEKNDFNDSAIGGTLIAFLRTETQYAKTGHHVYAATTVQSADVLMMKGEALVRQGHADLAVPLFNEVRHRTGLDDYKASDLTLDEIYDERGREFAWEGLRRQDMIRFGKWGEARDLKPAVSPAYTKLYPIPANIRKTNTNLKQNDGYTD